MNTRTTFPPAVTLAAAGPSMRDIAVAAEQARASMFVTDAMTEADRIIAIAGKRTDKSAFLALIINRLTAAAPCPNA